MSQASTPSQADFAAIREAPPFAELSAEAVAELLQGAVVRRYPKAALLFSAGDPADAFFAVVEGAVRLFALNADGSESTIDIVGARMTFAEAAIFAIGRYPVNAEAMDGARLVRIGAAVFLRKLSDNPRLALQMLASLGRWQLRLMGELWQLKAQTPAQRLAWYVQNLASVREGPVEVKLPYPKSLIASRIGIAPESLSRALSRLGEIGVESHGDVVQVRDIEALRRFSGL